MMDVSQIFNITQTIFKEQQEIENGSTDDFLFCFLLVYSFLFYLLVLR